MPALLLSAALVSLATDARSADAPPACERIITASVVAIEQLYTYNRFGAYNPAGLMYALRRDVVASQEIVSAGLSLKEGDAIPAQPDARNDALLAGKVRLREDKRPRPLVLRANEQDCLKVTFTNLLSPTLNGQELLKDPQTGQTIPLDSEEPSTRHASMHVNGLDYVVMPGESTMSTQTLTDAAGMHKRAYLAADGANVGRNLSSLAAPGQTKVYQWYAKQEGGYLFHSMAAPAGGEGDGGQLGLGLFGAVNVQPKGAKWYRSQTDAVDLQRATTGRNPAPFGGTPKIDYEAKRDEGTPLLNMLQAKGGKTFEIVHSDLNAVIDITAQDEHCKVANTPGHTGHGPGAACGKPYREFTTIFHDEITAVQAFRELADEGNPIASIKDGMGINYGVGGMGAPVLANRKKIGPAAQCAECKFEEFFLSSWANGDPAMVVQKDGATGKATKALYPDDPSNVHHSYMGDAVRFRNMHAGPKETHVFHLHAHQWVQDKHDPDSVYLDSQTISPGAVFSYEIHYGGSGNRNFTPGDSIFHCHLYPHFAQGMWELWRTHDVFEAGTPDRNLPDGEIAGGTPNPAIVPLPRTAMPHMPTDEFKGYPFYVAGQKGHRPPQPPLDFDNDNEIDNTKSDGGLRRHVVLDATTVDGIAAVERKYTDPALTGNELNKTAVQNAKRVTSQNSDTNLLAFAKRLDSARIQLLDPAGEPSEQAAMKFHAGQSGGAVPTTTDYQWPGLGYPSCDAKGNCFAARRDMVFHVNGKPAKPGAPYADPCRADAVDRKYRAAYLQFDMPVNKAGWHDPQARIAVLENDVADTLNYTRPAEPLFFRANSGECITFAATNLIPSNLNVDDFQIFSPTDVIGQHIHLVKFDVTSSDGSGNGWNYEDGTLSADEVRERILANNKYQKAVAGSQLLLPKQHRMFRDGPMAGDARGQCPTSLEQVTAEELEKHPWCGAQTTVQRWWADPLLDNKKSDRTLRTVFTHDHFGPSSHQHHGLYAALVVEPKDSVWTTLDGKQIIGGSRADGAGKAVPIPCRADGGPTSYAANVLLQPGAQQIADCSDTQRLFAAKGNADRREFALAFADFSILYDKDDKPINPPSRFERDLPMSVDHMPIPFPEGISGGDPGGQLLNYRNEPIPLRIAKTTTAADGTLIDFERGTNGVGGLPTPLVEQKAGKQGDPAHVFSSLDHEAPAQMPASIVVSPAGNADKMLFTELPPLRGLGDPATPLLLAYEGDKVQLRLIQGAQEENHVFTMHGVKWLSQPGSKSSGWMNAQHIGISEHFEFEINVDSPSPQQPTDYLYYSSATDNLWDGQWGLLRAFPSVSRDGSHMPVPQPGLKPLPSNPLGATLHPHTPAQGPCPAPFVRRDVAVAAWRARDLLPNRKLVYNDRFKLDDPNAIIFVRAEDEVAYRNGSKQPEPLVLRANAGDCIFVTLFNRIPDDTFDGPLPFAGEEEGLTLKQRAQNKEARSSWSYNMIPPIVRGFNFNQVKMSRNVALHPQLVAVNTNASDGAHVGNNKDTTAAPCTDCRHDLNTLGAGGLAELVSTPDAQGGLGHLAPTVARYTWYAGHFSKDGKTAAPVEFGAIALRDMADVVKHSSHGAIGALVIEPQCSISVPDNGQNASATVTYWQPEKVGGGTRCSLQPPRNAKRFREFVLMYQDDLSLQQNGSALANLRNGDDAEDSGQKAFNYRTEPLWARLGADPGSSPDEMANYDFSNALSSLAHGDPATPIFTAKAGMPVRFRVVHPGGHPRNHAFSLAGHDWIINPWTCPLSPKPGDCEYNTLGWNKFSVNRIGTAGGIGPARHLNILTQAGGAFHVPGDYLYRTQEGFMFGGGLWGIFRVEP